MKTELTAREKLRYWARALRAETDFYLNGRRYRSAVRFKAGRLLADEIGSENSRDISEELINGGQPETSGAREIYIDIPDRVSMELYRNRKRERESLALAHEAADEHTESERAEFLNIP